MTTQCGRRRGAAASAAFALVVSLLAADTASAQDMRFGVRGGVNFSTVNQESSLGSDGFTMRQGLVLIASPKLQAGSLPEFLDQARKEPGTLSHASYGAGSPSHLIMEWLKDETKTTMLHVPYRTTPVSELIGGQVDTVLEPVATAYPMIASGRVKALAYSGSQRHPAMPNVPTFAETVPGLSMMSWHGIWAPAATPPAFVDRLHATLLAASQDPDVQRRIKELNSEPLGVSRAEMREMVRRDSEIYGRIVKTKNIRVD